MPASNRTPHFDFPIYGPDDKISLLGDFNSAFSTLDEELYEASVSYDTLSGDVLTAKNSALTALSQSEEAKTTAQSAGTVANNALSQVAGASATANEAKSIAQTAQTLAEAASQDAADAAIEVGNAVSNANAAVTAANQASTNANNAAALAQTFETRVTNNTNNIAELQVASSEVPVTVWDGGPGSNVTVATGAEMGSVKTWTFTAPATGRCLVETSHGWTSNANSAGRERLVCGSYESFPGSTPGRKVQNVSKTSAYIRESHTLWMHVTQGESYTVHLHASTDPAADARVLSGFGMSATVFPSAE